MSMGASVVVTAGTPRTQHLTGAATAAREDAARALWNEHYAPLAGWCAALLGDRDAAHDIASEAFTRLLSRWVTVHDPVERLPDRLRMPVLLHYYADMSIAEVASALHKPQGTIKRMLFDARARLAGWLEEEER